jgi:hypothetical protein
MWTTAMFKLTTLSIRLKTAFMRLLDAMSCFIGSLIHWSGPRTCDMNTVIKQRDATFHLARCTHQLDDGCWLAAPGMTARGAPI